MVKGVDSPLFLLYNVIKIKKGEKTMIVYSKQTNLTKTRTFVHSEWTPFALLWGFYMSEGYNHVIQSNTLINYCMLIITCNHYIILYLIIVIYNHYIILCIHSCITI
ncbi:hypothetical protein CoNPh11_CDS0026 [Staphylococcus phage S-CoN_Ph11]|nr:hypothetical protein CoNPh11_CDS0026 [Staphylococcus phage S-CoN_Ph11]